MNPVWNIRQAKNTDADALKHLMAAAYTGYQDRMDGQRLPPMDADYADEIANYPAWVVDFKGVVVGGLIMVFNEEKATIANIAIDPNYQGKGIGGGLMKFADTKASEKGFSELHLATHVLLTENLALYRHLGWQEIHRDQIKVTMKKDL